MPTEANKRQHGCCRWNEAKPPGVPQQVTATISAGRPPPCSNAFPGRETFPYATFLQDGSVVGRREARRTSSGIAVPRDLRVPSSVLGTGCKQSPWDARRAGGSKAVSSGLPVSRGSASRIPLLPGSGGDETPVPAPCSPGVPADPTAEVGASKRPVPPSPRCRSHLRQRLRLPRAQLPDAAAHGAGAGPAPPAPPLKGGRDGAGRGGSALCRLQHPVPALDCARHGWPHGYGPVCGWDGVGDGAGDVEGRGGRWGWGWGQMEMGKGWGQGIGDGVGSGGDRVGDADKGGHWDIGTGGDGTEVVTCWEMGTGDGDGDGLWSRG